MSRRGRRPKVNADGQEYSVVVKGQKFKFRKGGDDRLRALGTPDRTSDDFLFARELVGKTIDAEYAREDAIDEGFDWSNEAF